MRKLMICFSILFIAFFPFQAFAQLNIGATDLKKALEQVVSDFPNDFAALRAEVVETNPQTIVYSTLLEMKSAEDNKITQHSGVKPVYSWQALMFTNDDFETVTKKYRALFKQLKNMSLTLKSQHSFGLNGEYISPDESKKFTSSFFRLVPAATNLTNLKIELSMQYELPEWKIRILVYQKEREDDEQGKVVEDGN